MRSLRHSLSWYTVCLPVLVKVDSNNADLAGTADGSLTTIVAVKPARFKRLQLVADQLTRNAQHSAGLNPKAFR
jgi:hypothetical protein